MSRSRNPKVPEAKSDRAGVRHGIHEVKWDHDPPRRGTDGVTITWEHPAGRGVRWEYCVSSGGLVPQSLAAVLLGVSVVTVNKWVRARKLYHIKADGHPSQIPLFEVKRILQEAAEAPVAPEPHSSSSVASTLHPPFRESGA